MADKDTFWLRTPLSRRRFLQASSVAGLTTAALGLARPAWSVQGSILKIRDYGDISSLDPAFFIAVPEENVMGAVYNKLITYKTGLKWGWQLQAAEAIRQVDPTHIEFTLRPGIRFSNGFGEMSAEDVKYSFERIVNPDLKSPNSGDMGSLEKVEITGKYTGVIVLKEPFQPLWNIALPYVTGNIISEKATESVGGKFANDAPCFSGPYKVKEWLPKQHTVLVRNEVWGGATPDFDEIHILPIDDEKTAEIAFEAGDVDFTRVSASSLATLKATPPAGAVVQTYPSLYYVWIGMNMAHPKLRNPKFRQAIQYAIDIASVVDAAYFGAAKPSTGTIAPGLVGHRDKSLIPPAGDLDKARALLQESGVTGDGLSLTLDVLDTASRVTAAQVIQADLARIGIKLQVNINESGAFWTLGSEKSGDRWKKLELEMGRFSMLPDPYYATEWFTCEQVGVWNWERFCSKEYDALNAQAVTASDPAKRAGMYRKMQDLMEQSGAYRFVTNEVTPLIYRDTVAPALRPDGLPLLRYFKQA